MGQLGPPWGGEARGQISKNRADFHINRIPIGCVSFFKLGVILSPFLSKTLGMPVCGGFSLVNRSGYPYSGCLKQRATQFYISSLLLGAWSVLGNGGSQGRSRSCPCPGGCEGSSHRLHRRGQGQLSLCRSGKTPQDLG